MKKGYILSKQAALFGKPEAIGFGVHGGFRVECIDKDLANKLIIENHYSHKIYNATYIHLGVFTDDGLHGVLQYGYAMNPASMSSVVADTAIDEYLELNRMWLDETLPRNSESRAISYSIKYIKRAYPKIQWIQSFADERCGRFGVVYQASNFEYFGEHTSVFWELDDTWYHNIAMTTATPRNEKERILQSRRDEATKHRMRQFRYLYFIDQRARDRCLLEQKPYPKHTDEDLAAAEERVFK